MNIFDAYEPPQMARSPLSWDQPMMQNHPQGGALMTEKPPIMPEEEEEDPWKRWIGDPSGFANAGMQTPALPDPTQQIQGLMSMAMQQASPQQKQGIEQKFGGLMAYLQSLGV